MFMKWFFWLSGVERIYFVNLVKMSKLQKLCKLFIQLFGLKKERQNMVVSESELSLLLRILKFKVIVVSREMRGGKPRFFFDKTMQYIIYCQESNHKKANFIIVHKRNGGGVRVRHKNNNEITEGTMQVMNFYKYTLFPHGNYYSYPQ